MKPLLIKQVQRKILLSGNRVLRGVNLFALRNIFLIIIITLISYEVLAKKIQINKIVNLNSPWGMTFLNENEVLVTEKKGKIRLINFSTLSIKDIKHLLLAADGIGKGPHRSRSTSSNFLVALHDELGNSCLWCLPKIHASQSSTFLDIVANHENLYFSEYKDLQNLNAPIKNATNNWRKVYNFS